MLIYRRTINKFFEVCSSIKYGNNKASFLLPFLLYEF